MGKKQMKNVFLVCSVVLTILTMSVQGMKMTVYAEEYEYDELNRVTKVTYENGETVEYVYDSNGNIIETIVCPESSAGSSGDQNTDNPIDADGSVDIENKPTGANGDTQPDNPKESIVPVESVEAIEPGKAGQTESVRRIVEEFTYWLENLVQPIVYMENLVQRLTEFAKSLREDLGELL